MNINPEMVTAITALVAVVVGPLLSIYVARKQINTEALSKNRQEWINKLRNELAELITIVMHVPPAYAANSINNQEAIAKHGELTEKVELVKLLLNPKESDHQELVRLITSASIQVKDAINQRQGNAVKLEEVAERVVKQAQIILKREWERVKKGE
jgi:hypothetical protein